MVIKVVIAMVIVLIIQVIIELDFVFKELIVIVLKVADSQIS